MSQYNNNYKLDEFKEFLTKYYSCLDYEFLPEFQFLNNFKDDIIFGILVQIKNWKVPRRIGHLHRDQDASREEKNVYYLEVATCFRGCHKCKKRVKDIGREMRNTGIEYITRMNDKNKMFFIMEYKNKEEEGKIVVYLKSLISKKYYNLWFAVPLLSSNEEKEKKEEEKKKESIDEENDVDATVDGEKSEIKKCDGELVGVGRRKFKMGKVNNAIYLQATICYKNGECNSCKLRLEKNRKEIESKKIEFYEKKLNKDEVFFVFPIQTKKKAKIVEDYINGKINGKYDKLTFDVPYVKINIPIVKKKIKKRKEEFDVFEERNDSEDIDKVVSKFREMIQKKDSLLEICREKGYDKNFLISVLARHEGTGYDFNWSLFHLEQFINIEEKSQNQQCPKCVSDLLDNHDIISFIIYSTTNGPNPFKDKAHSIYQHYHYYRICNRIINCINKKNKYLF